MPMTKPSSLLVAVCLLATVALLGCTGGCEPKPQIIHVDELTPRVRVRLLAGVAHVTLQPDAATPLFNAAAGKAIGISLPPGRPIDFSFDGNGWRIGNRAFIGVPLTVAPDVD